MRHFPFVVCVLAFASAWASAQSTTFTYQGELKSGGTLASGLHDFRFRLFDAAVSGGQVGTQLCADNVQVTDGKFTTPLDFGQAFVSTAPRFLEIEVRRDTGQNCESAGGFVVLSPRQPVTPAPRATSASVANALGSPDGSRPNAVIVDNTGRVGLGTLTPTHNLHIATGGPTIALQDTNASSQQAGYVSYRDNANVERGWIGYGTPGDPDFSIVNARTSGDIVLRPFFGNVGINNASPAAALDVAGNGLFSGSLGVMGPVGIGTSSPTVRLDVRGDIKLGTSGQFFAPAGEENLRMIRGTVETNGAILFGSGFSVSHPSTGRYLLTFTTPFSRTPSVIASAHQTPNERNDAYYLSLSSSGCEIQILGGPGFADQGWSFVAIGPR